MTKMTDLQIAGICHEANRHYCRQLGDLTQRKWKNAEEWQRASAIKGVKFHRENPNAPAFATHEEWKEEKVRDGWVYGEVKDTDKKTHPCIVPFEKLPVDQQRKDVLFSAIVKALRD